MPEDVAQEAMEVGVLMAGLTVCTINLMSITVKQISCFLGYLPSYFSYEWYQKASSVGINQYQIKMVDVVEKI